MKILKFIPISLALVTIPIAFFVMFQVNTNIKFETLYFLPLVTGILIFLQSASVYKVKGYSPMIIGGVYYIRNVIAPFILTIDDYQSKFNYISRQDINGAIALMVYETIIVNVMIVVFSQKIKEQPVKEWGLGKIYIGDIIYKLALMFAVIIIIYCLISSEKLRFSFYSIFTSNFYEVGSDRLDLEGGPLYTGGKVLIDALRLIIPSTLIIVIRNRYGSSIATLIVSVLVAMMQVLFMTDGNAYILLLVVVQLVLIYRLHEKYRKLMVYVMTTFAILAVALMAVNRFLLSASAYSSSLSTFLQSYFGGICGVAGIFVVSPGEEFSFWLLDIINAIPFKGTLFGYTAEDILLVNVYNSVNSSHSQILPTIAEGYYYFGPLLAPLYSCVFVYIALAFEKKAKVQKHYLYFVLDCLICVMAAISPVTYDMRIFFRNVLNIFIFMWLFTRLSKGVSLYMVKEHERVKD